MEEQNQQNQQNIEKVSFEDTSQYDRGDNKKKIIFLIIIILIAIGLAVGSIFLIRRMFVKKGDNVQSTTTTQAYFDKTINDTYKVDKDFDGILDIDEKKYGTSATSSDTDEDGLTDDSEIFNFKTNPLKADTDGDGYSDGYEVRRGFNPLGSGML